MKVATDVGLMFLMMNLSKYWQRSGQKDQPCGPNQIKEQRKRAKLIKMN